MNWSFLGGTLEQRKWWTPGVQKAPSPRLPMLLERLSLYTVTSLVASLELIENTILGQALSGLPRGGYIKAGRAQ